MKKQVGYVLMWALAVVVAIAVGLTATGLVGASVRGRGPLGNEVDRNADAKERGRPEPGATRVSKTFTGDYGRFTVVCKGVYAIGSRAEANRSAGWRVVSYEPGPDDDVDAVFSNRSRSVELDVFCNGGKPFLDEMERKRLPDDD